MDGGDRRWEYLPRIGAPLNFGICDDLRNGVWKIVSVFIKETIFMSPKELWGKTLCAPGLNTCERTRGEHTHHTPQLVVIP